MTSILTRSIVSSPFKSARIMVATLLLVAVVPALGATPGRTFDVLHYVVDLSPEIDSGRVSGQATIVLKGVAPTTELVFDAGDLEVATVVSGDLTLQHRKSGSSLRIALLKPLAVGEERTLTVTYQGRPRFGLEFHPDRSEVYTIFSTSQWMVCVDAPDERATLDLTVRLPAGLKAAGVGRKLPSSDASIHRWRLDTPTPSYVYGFAAGRYAEFSETSRGIPLRYLSTERSPDELRRIFQETADMLRFFGKRAGLHYRGTYTQVLVAKTIGQEMARLSLMSEAYGLRVLDDPTNVALVAHEAAHQWWGNLLTCQDWGHFWLNEGFANFMAAAWLEHRHGAEAYAEQVEGWRRRLEKLRADGKDKPLVYENWNKPTADDRAVVYQKGAYFLHLLRQELGEKAFWRGIRRYTRDHARRSVVTDDLRLAMEEASKKDLADLFHEWAQ